MPTTTPGPVPTGTAAKALGVHRGTLQKWWRDGNVRPAYVTPGGQARWDMDDLWRQIRAWRTRLAEQGDEEPELPDEPG